MRYRSDRSLNKIERSCRGVRTETDVEIYAWRTSHKGRKPIRRLLLVPITTQYFIKNVAAFKTHGRYLLTNFEWNRIFPRHLEIFVSDIPYAGDRYTFIRTTSE